jgi:hypothetical protein
MPKGKKTTGTATTTMSKSAAARQWMKDHPTETTASAVVAGVKKDYGLSITDGTVYNQRSAVTSTKKKGSTAKAAATLSPVKKAAKVKKYGKKAKSAPIILQIPLTKQTIMAAKAFSEAAGGTTSAKALLDLIEMVRS